MIEEKKNPIIFVVVVVYLLSFKLMIADCTIFQNFLRPPTKSVNPHPYRATYTRYLVYLLIFIKTLKNADQIYTFLMKLKLNTRIGVISIVKKDFKTAQFIKIIPHYKKIGYNINALQQTACLVANPITVGNFVFLFNCTPMGRTSDSMMVPT